MAKTRNDKKREIITYLENHASERDILSLREKELVDEFSDGHHTKESIKEIIDEILEEEPIVGKSCQIDLLYPEKSEQEIEDTIESGDEWTIRNVFLTGFYFFFILVIGLDSTDIFLQASDDQVIWVAFVGILSSYILGQITRKASKIIEANVPRIRNYKTVIYSVGGMVAFSSMLIFGYGYYLSKDIPPVVIATFIPASVVAGVEIGRYVESKGSRE